MKLLEEMTPAEKRIELAHKLNYMIQKQKQLMEQEKQKEHVKKISEEDGPDEKS